MAVFAFLLTYSALGQTREAEFVAPEYNIKLVHPELLSKLSSIHNFVEDSSGYLWIASPEGLACLDGKNLWMYNNGNETGGFGLTENGFGYHDVYIDKNNMLWARELWTRGSLSNNITGIDPVSREEMYGFPEFPDGSKYLASSPEVEVYCLYAFNGDDSLHYQCLSCEDKQIKFLIEASGYKSFRLTNGQMWVLTYDELLRFSYAGSLQDKVPMGPSMDFNLFDQQQGIFIWDTVKNSIQDYSDVILKLIEKQFPSALSSDFNRIKRWSNGDIFASIGNVMLRFSPILETAKAFRENISSGNSLTSMRGLVEGPDGTIYASYYTGVGYKPPGAVEFYNFRDIHTREKKAEMTYSLSLWQNKLIWNNIVFDLNSNNQSWFHNDQYGALINHYLLEDTL